MRVPGSIWEQKSTLFFNSPRNDINKELSKSNCLNMRKLTLNIGTIRWYADICRRKNSHANFFWMIRTVNNFLTAQWFFFNFHQMLFKQNTFIWSYKSWGSLNQPNSWPAKHCLYYLARIFTTTKYQTISNKSKRMPACIKLETV